MNIVSWSVLCVLSVCFGKGYGILCYYCHQTSKECNNGVVGSIYTKNCTEDKCAVMKYETPMPGRKVLATLRDCASYTEHELVERISPDMKSPAKIILFQECDDRLCNSGSDVRFCKNIFVITVLLNLYFLR